MGKEFWGALVLMGVLLAGTLGVAWGMQRVHETAAEKLEYAAEQAQNGDMEQAVVLFRQAREHWKRHQEASASVADHSPMDEIEMLFAEAEVYAHRQEITDFAAACAHLSRMVHAMAEAQKLTWWNLL